MIFVDVCEETIKEHEEWEWDEPTSDKRDPKNKPQEKADHGIDSLSYFLVKHFDEKAPENPAAVRKRELDGDYQHKLAVQADMESQLKKQNKGIRVKQNASGVVR